MTVFVSLLLAVLAFAFAAYPFFKRRVAATGAADDDKLQELQSKKNTTYSMLKELEFDYESGILTEEDYQALETRYKGRAVSILRDIDNAGKDAEPEDEIEKQILKMRRGKGQFCPKCGVKHQAEDLFCAHCGARLK